MAEGDVMGISDREGRPRTLASGSHFFYPLFLTTRTYFVRQCTRRTLVGAGGVVMSTSGNLSSPTLKWLSPYQYFPLNCET